MNREILFRGKRVDNEEWVEGVTYIADPDLDTVCICGYDYYTDEDGWQRDEYGHEVIPATVGRFTGLCDRNGTKIFEGDIVKEFYPNCSIEDYRYDVGRVFYYKNMARFLRTSKRFPDCYADMTIDKTNSNCEVIGNIHDNPELIKGEENE